MSVCAPVPSLSASVHLSPLLMRLYHAIYAILLRLGRRAAEGVGDLAHTWEAASGSKLGVKAELKTVVTGARYVDGRAVSCTMANDGLSE